MIPKFPAEVAYLGGLLRKSKLVETEKGFYEIHIEHEREFLEAVDTALKHKLDGKYKVEGNKLVINSPDMFDILVQYFGHPNADRKWRMTLDLKMGRLDHKAAFLRGLFDSMGTVEDTLVLKYHWHAEDLKEVKELLEELGIKTVMKKNELRVKNPKDYLAVIGTLRPVHQKRLIAKLAG